MSKNKNITFKDIDEELYHRTRTLKGQLKADTWPDFLRKICNIAEDSLR